MRFIEKANWFVVGLALFGLTLAGCWSKNEDQPKQRKDDFRIAQPPKFGSGPSGGSPSSGEEGDESFAQKPNDPPALVEAKQRLRSFEQKRAKIEPLLEKAETDRDDLVAKLREVGVNSTVDLKGNIRGQKLAESVQKVGTEIAGLERQMAVLDTAILDAKSVIRRMEREAAGISEGEMRKLAEQLRDVEDRTDGSALPVTPLDVDAALEKALKASRTDSTARPSSRQSLAAQLVGRWQVAEGKKKGTIEFTKGGTALVVWSDGLRNALGESERRATLKYSLSGMTLKLEEPGEFEYRQKQEMKIEVISPDEMIVVVEKRAMSFDWIQGRIRRVK